MPKLIDFPNEWIAFFVFFSIILFFIGLAELARKLLKWRPESSRKFVHVMVGVLVSFAPFFLNTAFPVILLGAIFTLINYLTLKSNALEGMHATERISYGTVYFPIAFAILVAIYWERNMSIFLTSMLILAFADTAATLIGERRPTRKKYHLWEDGKSLAGSGAFMLTAMLVIGIFFPFFQNLMGQTPLGLLPLSALILFGAFMATIGEAVSRQGSDNLTLTLSAALSMDLMLFSLDNGRVLPLLGWILFSALLGYGAYRLKALNVSGAIGAFILGVFMFGMGGWQTMLPLIGFFVFSSILSKIADHHASSSTISSKGSQRDIVQVFSNGGIALVLSIGWYITGFTQEWMYFAFLASLAAATADTWETEIGSFSRKDPLHIISWTRVPKGFSGGISLRGSLGGILGAGFIALIGYFIYDTGITTFVLVLIIISGFLGSVIDSLLGATIQAKFECQVCGKSTEKRIHCGQETRHLSGIRKLDNDWVNMICTASGALLFYMLFLIIS